MRKRGVPLSMQAFPLALLSWWRISLAFCWKSDPPLSMLSASPPTALRSSLLHNCIYQVQSWIHLLVRSNEPIKSLMIAILLVRNYLNNLRFPAACDPAFESHMLRTSVMWVYLILYLQMGVSGPLDTMSRGLLSTKPIQM